MRVNKRWLCGTITKESPEHPGWFWIKWDDGKLGFHHESEFERSTMGATPEDYCKVHGHVWKVVSGYVLSRACMRCGIRQKP